MVADAAHTGNGFPFLIHDGDGQVIGNGKDLRMDTVGRHGTQDAFLHPEGFRTRHGQLIAKIHGQIQ